MRKRAITIAERRFAEQRQELSRLGLQARFERIYHTNLWSDPETRSGTGSSLDSTRVLREKLPNALRELGTRVLLDAPCGDFAWMDHVDLSGIEYIGADIVRSIIQSNRQDYAREGREFIELDLTSDELPDADVLLCRDCLVHLSYANIARVVENVCRSNIRFILMTAFPGRGDNKDVDDGDWRPLDFEAAPFLFPKPLLTIVEECDEEGGSYADKSLCAWAVSDIPDAKVRGAFTDQK
jgi:hypothetical protein